MESNVFKICVVGGGVIGMSTAVSIVEDILNAKVTVIAEKFSPETTSDGAAGLWMPYLLGSDTPLYNQVYWIKETFEFLKRLYTTEKSSEVGVSLATGYCIDDEEKPDPIWKDVVFGYRQMQIRELQMFGARQGFQSLGGNILQRKVESLMELAKDYDVVVNCTGTCAKHVANDPAMYPIRGQIMRVYAPWVKMFVITDDYYIIPNSESVVLGGTHQENNWNLTATAKDRDNIFTNCCKFMPSLKNAKVIKDWVGLRPGRKCVRLERQQMQCSSKTLQVIHNYGHGGCGVTLFWGCALNTTKLVKEVLNEFNNPWNSTNLPKSHL